MWWARRRKAALVVVLRAGSLDALCPAAAPAAGQGPGVQGASAASASRWCSLQRPVVFGNAASAPAAAANPAAATGAAPAALAAPDAPPQPAAAALRDAVVAAFAGLKAELASAAAEHRLPPTAQLVVLLAGPAAGVLSVPWSDALLRPDTAQRHARAELLARGFAVQPEDSVCIDARPARGQPRAVFWVPIWLQREVRALASSLQVRSCQLQSLNLVAAAWLMHQPHDGRLWGLLGSGALQLWSAVDASAAGEVLADSPAAGPPEARVQALWQRAGLRTPLLAEARLRVLGLDEPPPADAARAGLASASARDASVDWLPWPLQTGASGRAALDLHLLRQAQASPVLPLALLPTPARGFLGADATPLWWAATAAALVASLALAWSAVQREAALQEARAAPAAPATPRVVATTAAERGELRAVNAAVQQLNLPLPQLLRTLQPPRDIAVRLHALDLAPRSSESAAGGTSGASARTLVKLSAEAPRSRDMTRYVDFLVGRQGMAAVQLVRHEVDGTGAAGEIYRFEVELEWPR